MKPLLLTALIPFALAAGAAAAAPPQDATAPSAPAAPAAQALQVDALLAGDWRDDGDRARDVYRHPVDTLAFFGLAPGQTVIEITPGGGWYAELLAPYLREDGHYVAAVWDDAITGQPAYRYALNQRLREKFAGNAAVYGQPEVRTFDPAAPVFGPAGSADLVLTFRNAHNWVAEENAAEYFQAFYDVLKPGGTLGVVDHRARPGTDLEKMKQSGYLTEELVIDLARDAGFELDARSEVNANPRDDTDHPNGVWTLPPTNDHDAEDDEMYRAIGESDRMTLRFTKPRD